MGKYLYDLRLFLVMNSVWCGTSSTSSSLSLRMFSLRNAVDIGGRTTAVDI